MSLPSIPYELLLPIIKFLSAPDLMTLRLVSREFTPWCNTVLFRDLNLDERHTCRIGFLKRFGFHINYLSVLGLDKNSAKYPKLLEYCTNLKEVHLMRSELDASVIRGFSKHLNMRVFKACLSAHRHLSSDLSMWNQLESLKKLTTLHLFDIDHRVAEHLFYNLPRLQDFRVKLISEETAFGISQSLKKNYFNPYLKTVHVESWVNEVEVDQLILLRPECFPNLQNLELIAYQATTLSWLQNTWPSLKKVRIDFVRSDEQVQSLMTNLPNLTKFQCIMWCSSGKLLNQMLFHIATIDSLYIESSISQDVLQDLAPAPQILDLQIGVVHFNAGALSVLHLTFPNAKYVRLGHCKSDPEVVNSLNTPQFNSPSLAWETLAVFQLNPVIAAIAHCAPNLKTVVYDMASKQCDAVKFKRLAASSALKISKRVESFLF